MTFKIEYQPRYGYDEIYHHLTELKSSQSTDFWLNETVAVASIQTRNILYQLQPQIDPSSTLNALFQEALAHFEQIVPKFASLNLPDDALFALLSKISPRLHLRVISKKFKEIIDLTIIKLKFKQDIPLETEKLFLFVNQFPALTSLNFYNCEWIEDRHLECLKDIPFTSLVLYHCKTITRIGLNFLKGKPLQKLYHSCELNAEEIHNLLDEMPIEKLSFMNADSLEDEDFAFLKDKKIKSISICTRNRNYNFLQYLEGQPIRFLELLCSWRLKDTDLVNLREFPLEKLTLLNSWDLTDSGLIHLKGLPIHVLSLTGCHNITDAGLFHLKDLPLHNLAISCCENVTVTGLQYLINIKTLTTITIRYCDQIPKTYNKKPSL